MAGNGYRRGYGYDTTVDGKEYEPDYGSDENLSGKRSLNERQI